MLYSVRESKCRDGKSASHNMGGIGALRSSASHTRCRLLNRLISKFGMSIEASLLTLP